ncbi:hypothetical protein JCGZ_27120 [Jatropha curcas]|uniref:Uncharacterized protein n=1 Tax=Jatropha curcas TaxID=180498 RepID=A0A067JIP3_JATCU|nr:hypothetical protein JCGZ_27120 [Jatropha curcas]
MSHGMKLWEFILDARTTIILWNDLPSYLCWGTSELYGVLQSTSGARHLSSGLHHYLVACTIKSTKCGKSGGNAYAAASGSTGYLCGSRIVPERRALAILSILFPRFGLVSIESYPFEACMSLTLISMRGLFLGVEHGGLAGGMLILPQCLNVPAATEQSYLGPDREVPMGEVVAYPDFIQVTIGERVYEWEFGPDRRRIPHDVPYYMLSTRSIRLEQDIAASRRELVSRRSLGRFCAWCLCDFCEDPALVHVPPPTKFDPFVKVEELDRGQGDAQLSSVASTSQSTDPALPSLSFGAHRAANTMHARDPSREPILGVSFGLHHVIIADYNEVCQLYEAERLKLVMVRLPDEHVSVSIKITTQRKYAVHMPYNLFHHNDFEICPLFEEFSIIFRRIPIIEEVPMVLRLDIDPASLILPVFDFSTYEIASYDFGADAFPLLPFVDHALSVDRTSSYWPSLICFCILS